MLKEHILDHRYFGTPDEDTVIIEHQPGFCSSVSLAFANQEYWTYSSATIDIRHNINNLNINLHYIGSRSVTKEVFFDTVAKHYPLFFEWLLFHPEWL